MAANVKTEMLTKETVNLRVPRFVKVAGWKGLTGLFAATLFDIIHPLSGAIFASSQSVMQQLLAPGVKELLTDGNNLPSKIYIYVVTFIFSAAVSISATLSLGFPMSFPAAIWLSIFMIPTSLVIDYLFQNFIASNSSKPSK